MTTDSIDDPTDLEPPRRSSALVQQFWNFVPIIGVAACCYFLAAYKDDVKYLLQPSTPVDLGGPGAYHMEPAAHGVYAKIRGQVHSDGARFQRATSNGKVWPLMGAPVILERTNFDDLRGDVTAEGMLQIDDRLEKQYVPVIAAFHKHNQLGLPGPDVGTSHTFVLVMGHTPHGIDKTNVCMVGLIGLFLLNAWWVVRPLIRRR